MKAVFEVDTLQRRIEIGCAPDEHGVEQAVSLTLRATLDGRSMFAGDTLTPPFDYCAMVDAVDGRPSRNDVISPPNCGLAELEAARV